MKKLSVLVLVVFFTGLLISLHGQNTASKFNEKGFPNEIFLPQIDGEWWEIAHNPDLGETGSDRQQPVDFGIWQAADGTFQVWSCIRHTNFGGRTRLFYRWEGKYITDKNWQPMGIAMVSDTTLGEMKGGLQAPFVLETQGGYYMFYGDWNRICLARSCDGKNFKRVLNRQGNPSLFSGPLYNTRDPMVLENNGIYYCYYTSHLRKDEESMRPKSAVFLRTSTDLENWTDPVEVSRGGSVVNDCPWYGGDSECPFVLEIEGNYILFRNQRYGMENSNAQFYSSNPFNFGLDHDGFLIGKLPVAAPEIIKVGTQYYIAALNPALDGIRIAKLKFIKAKK